MPSAAENGSRAQGSALAIQDAQQEGAAPAAHELGDAPQIAGDDLMLLAGEGPGLRELQVPALDGRQVPVPQQLIADRCQVAADLLYEDRRLHPAQG